MKLFPVSGSEADLAAGSSCSKEDNDQEDASANAGYSVDILADEAEHPESEERANENASSDAEHTGNDPVSRDAAFGESFYVC